MDDFKEKKITGRCAVDRMLSVIGGAWTPYLLWMLATEGRLRFGAFQRMLPRISTKVLTERLRMLEHAGLVNREQAPTIPPQVTYSLTERGAELQQALQDLGEIARRWDAEGWSPENP